MFAVFFMTLTLLLLTLNPFNLQMPVGAFIWHFFSEFDFFMNILLFLPLGMALRHAQKFNHWQAVLYAALISCIAELAQLYIPARYSGLMDIISNALGAYLGFVVWGLAAKQRLHMLPALLIILLTPLGWIAAMRSLLSSTPIAVLSIELIMAAVLFNYACQPRRCLPPQQALRSLLRRIQRPLNYAIARRYFYAYFPMLLWNAWLLATLSGFLVINPKALLALFVFAFFLPWILLQFQVFMQYMLNYLGILVLLLMLIYNFYYFVEITPDTWQVLRNLNWIEILLFSLWWSYGAWMIGKHLRPVYSTAESK